MRGEADAFAGAGVFERLHTSRKPGAAGTLGFILRSIGKHAWQLGSLAAKGSGSNALPPG